MRSIQLFATFLLLSPCSAQLVNGSFESNGLPSLAGWDMACTCSEPTSSNVVPGGTGDWSLRMNSSDPINNCLCPLNGYNRQAVPWLTPGPWRLSAWIKGAGPDGIDGSRVMVVSGLDFFAQTILGMLGVMDSVWTYRDGIFNVPLGVDPDSLFVVFLPDGLPNSQVRPVFFDDIGLSQDVNTSVLDGSMAAHLNVRPNPAGDRLWVDLPNAPLSIVALDATGRSHALKNFQHTSRTLELDVSALPSGVNVLRFATSSGSHTVRFIKT